ncbi:P-loop NTPase [Candidatus Bipolaricaulota bacterium]|nr:P-loop NTPase [Candidatus Bipolaricaulota bacterium]
MKVIVAGKGGCGKSTVSTLLAKVLAERGSRVLVIDTDESNFGLHTHLGLKQPEDFMNYFGGKKVLFERVKAIQKRWGMDELPPEYLAEKGNLKLMAMGKIYDFGEGCACPINALSSRFLEVLELKDDDFLIADTDAGIEHLGRGVEKGCDLILVVVDPSQESIGLANRIAAMAKSIDKPVYYILNKVDSKMEGLLLESLDESRVIAAVPQDERILQYGLEGRELTLNVEGIEELADFLCELKN